MASGRPVVATAVAGVRELVRDGETGFLVAPGRSDELADALQRLLEDAALRQRMGEAGRRYVAQNYDIDAVAGSLEDLFDRLLGGRPEPRAVRALHHGNGHHAGEVDPALEVDAVAS